MQLPRRFFLARFCVSALLTRLGAALCLVLLVLLSGFRPPHDTPLPVHAAAVRSAALPAAVSERLLAGIDAMYTMRFSDALTLFDGVIAEHPSEPRAYFFRASVFLWRYMFDYSQPDLKRFYAASERALMVAEALQKQYPNDMYPQTIIGAMYAFRALANFKAENFIKGVLDMRTSYNYLSDVVKRDPSQYDAYMGLGLFHFAMGALPKQVRTMANLVGMKGDCALGMQEIEIAATKSLFAANDATMCLAMLHIYFNKDYTTGLRYLESMLRKYPNNIPMLYTRGNVQFFVKKLPFAIESYKTVVRLADTNFKTFTTFAHYRLGESYFRLNDFQQAKFHFQRYFKAPYERSFRASSFLRLAMMYEIEGNRAEAEKGYRKAADVGIWTEPEDRYAIRKAKQLLQQTMSAAAVQLIKGANCVEAGKFQKALYSSSLIRH